jgi:hypothetical protein
MDHTPTGRVTFEEIDYCRQDPIVLTDFVSQYPTVNALLGNWDALTADDIAFNDWTEQAKKMLAAVELDDIFHPEF